VVQQELDAEAQQEIIGGNVTRSHAGKVSHQIDINEFYMKIHEEQLDVCLVGNIQRYYL
jgi:hypothetical protein